MSEKTLKAAVVGTGHLGRHHVRILSQLPGIDFVGAYDADPEQLAAITGEHGVPALPSAEAAGDADVVVVATPTVNHRATAGMLLERGCHVLVEKPMALTTEDAIAMTVAAASSRGHLMVGYKWRCNPVWRKAINRVVPGGA